MTYDLKRTAVLTLSAFLLLAALLATLPGNADAVAVWKKFKSAGRVNDIVLRSDNRFVISSGGKLFVVSRSGRLQRFSNGRKRGRNYSFPKPEVEPYITQAPYNACGFRAGHIFAMLGNPPRIVRINRAGVLRPFVSLPVGLEPSGLVFDTTGLFQYRLLVTDRNRSANTTDVYAIGCGSALTQIATGLPRLEGGLAIAPPSFGPYAGHLLAPDEGSGNVYAVSPAGVPNVISTPPAPTGGDVGVESLGVVPAGLGKRSAAYVSDRKTPGNFQPGTGAIVRIPWPSLQANGIIAGDVLVVTEGGALTFGIRGPCGAMCATTPLVAVGSSKAHIEGHVVFARKRLAKPRRR